MCYTCGCKLPYEDHGDPDNLVEAHLRRAGDTEAIAHEGVARAKENLLELLEVQRRQGELVEPREDYS